MMDRRNKKRKNEEIRELIQLLKDSELTSTPETKDESWLLVIKDAGRREKRIKRRKSLIALVSTAAIIATILWIGNTVDSNENHLDSLSIESFAMAEHHSAQNVSDITLIISQDKQVKLKEEDKEVIYTNTGNIISNTLDIDTHSKEDNSTTDENKYNQIIVPKGKRISLTLSDNTKLWINSNTRVIYPRKFSKKEREIFVDGEVYMNIHASKNYPFTIKTNQGFEVKVTGTSLNINTYKSQRLANVVLVEGIANVKDKNNKTK